MCYDDKTIPVCLECDSAEVGVEVTKLCKRCGIAFCLHYASTVDFRYCSNCMLDFHVNKSTERRVVEFKNEEGEITSRRRQLAKNIKLVGTDWLFAQSEILTLNDVELEEAVEYHKEMASILDREQRERNTERIRKLASIKIVMPGREASNGNGSTKKQKKQKKVAAQPTMADMTAVIQKMMASGMSFEDIAKKMGMKLP